MAQLKEGSVIKKTTGNEAIATVSDMPSKVSELENDSGYVTNADLGDAGFGDMVKAVYDTNDNGIVDNAEKVSGFTVGTNVPANAKFTDTNTITTINGKTGAISKADIVALGIPAQDTVYTHPTTAGNKHMPTGGTVGQVLKNTASGTATWQNETDTITTINGKTGAISKADIIALGIPASDTNTTYTAGAGLTLTGTSFAVGTPSTITNATTNSTTATSHSHALTLTKADITALGIPSTDTNTTYTEITTAEIDAGTASTLRTITGRRVKYILDKVQGWIGGLTKSDVGLSNVDNLSAASIRSGTTKANVGLGNVDNNKQMPIAGGTFTGVAMAQANTSYTTRQLRNTILSTGNPSGGSNGDIWIKYK